jgi:hypothetical protein
MSNSIITDSIKNASEVSVIKIMLSNDAGLELDLSGRYVSFSIYENLFSNYLSGSLNIQDDANLIQNSPIIGNERLEIIFKTPSTNEVKKKFVVYDISVNERIPGKDQSIFTLQFASPQFQTGTTRLISKSFKNVAVSYVAESLFEEFLLENEKEDKFNFVRDTGERTSVVIPNWTPFQTMNWLSSRASYFENYDYVFYEGLDSFYFVPLSFLKRANPTRIYFHFPQNVLVQSLFKNIELEMSKILEYRILLEPTNKKEIENSGMINSYAISHDTTFKTLTPNYQSFIEDYNNEDLTRLSKNPLVPLSYAQKVSPVSKYFIRNQSSFAFDGVREQFSPFTIQKRTAHILKNNSVVIKLEVHGDSRRRVGEIIEVLIPAPDFLPTKNPDEILDKRISGRYMITSIGHHVSQYDGYHMGMEAIRDSYGEPIPDRVEISAE